MIKKLISKSVEGILQQAVYQELYASHAYKHLANKTRALGLFGASSYFTKESKDELSHYERLAKYIDDRGSIAEIPEIESCNDEIADLKSAIQYAYDLEYELGEKYNKWYTLVDPTTQNFITKYLKIQTQSIAELADVLKRLELAGDDKSAILIIDKELGK